MECLFNLLTEFKIKQIYINLHVWIFIIFASVSKKSQKNNKNLTKS